MSLGKKKIQHQAAAAGITGTDHFNPFLYTGTGSSADTNFTGVGFDPDWVWVKNRDLSENHGTGDTVRGGGKLLYPNLDLAETSTAYITPITDGFTISTGNNNVGADKYIAWCWKAGGSAVSNTVGSETTTVSANQDAGFSIVKLNKTDTNLRTYGHGLSSVPEMIILKRTASSNDWLVYHKDLGNTIRISLNSTAAQVTGTGVWGSTTPTSSVFTLENQLGGDHIAFCFHSVDGYQKIGSYTGTGATGNAITTGFEPRFLMIKSSSNAEPWFILDAARDTSNPRDNRLMADSNATEDDGSVHTVNFDSNGFTANGTVGNGTNGSGVTYIYLAIA